MNDEKCPPTTRLEEAGTVQPLPSEAPSLPAGGVARERLPLVLRRSSRFEVHKLLGRGAFGDVYLAHDRHLSRLVAIKTPRTSRLTASDDLEHFLCEARAAASLRHPGIVTVHDVHSDKDGVFIVLEFVEGCTLSEYVQRELLSLEETVRLMIDTAEAVGFAHEHGLVHRDLKPSNILVDARQCIRITDFGLAIHQRGQRLLAREVVGTPTYMAPEQVRGETHRLDARTDVWSLGVILYWLLTGRRAFEGGASAELFDEILHREPRPPRQIVSGIPRELERICLKSLSKRMSDRYANANELADDLRHWAGMTPQRDAETTITAPLVSDKPSTRIEAPVIPKGLRSFDQHDADFYLSLLPGPFDRQGLPESVRFWKQQIEENDPAATFAVGLMYGPSGCGKTSLMRAGVLPRLAGHVRWVYVEAAPDDTEKRLQRAIVRAFPDLSPGLPLVEMLVELREGQHLRPGQKLFLALDQFEQWLNGRETEAEEPLVAALRHCDGGRLQALVMVRDDFSMAATRFMNALEIPIVEGHNCAAVDVFRREHAGRVLRRFGEAFGRLSPDEPAEGSRFIEQALDLLAEGNVVAPVRLAAFAELTRHQEWNSATLRRLGGSEGLGVALLEACLGEETVNPTHRQHRQAARSVLEALLPEDRTSLKGRMRSQAELMAAAGYAERPRDFENLLQMLDKELRLISPADPQQGVWEDSGSDLESSSRRERYFQLTHDYLVPSLNAWLHSKQRETRTGRAMLLLESLAADWNARPDPRRLPTWVEWASLRALTRPVRWTGPQRRMMAAADRRHLTRLAALVVVALASLTAVWQVRRHQQHLWREEQARAAAERLLTADVALLPGMLHDLDALDSPAAQNVLRHAAVAEDRIADEKLRAQLFLARESPAAREFLLSRLLASPSEEHRIIAQRLAPYADSLAPKLWSEVENAASEDRLLRAAAALATWDSPNPAWIKAGPQVADALARHANPYQLPGWVEALTPVGRRLTPPLAARFREPTSSPAERTAAAAALVRYLRSEPAELARLAVDAGPESFAIFLTELERHAAAAVETLRGATDEDAASDDAGQRVAAARRRAVAVIALARLGSDAEFWSALESAESPDLRTAVIDRCSSYGVPSAMLLARLTQEANPLGRQAALIALANYQSRLSPERKEELIRHCLRLYEHDPHPGVHSAAEWTLRHLGEHKALASLRDALAGQDAPDQEWRINRHGITLVTVRGPQEFVQGSPASETERENIEPQKTVRLPRSFAISAHEVTVEQFLRLHPDFDYAVAVTSSNDCPVSNVSWLDAVRFCRRLSEAEGVPEEEMCYPPVDQIDVDLALPEDWQERTGYRLPTEAEWECACRAGAQTSRFFGDDASRLVAYGVYIANSGEELWPVGSLRPNPWGLFDVYGNVLEWCQDTTSAGGIHEGDPQSLTHRVLRSGTYRSVERENRSAKRYLYTPKARFSFFGFRVVHTVRD